MDAASIRSVVQQGLAIPCATCKKYWRGVDAGLGGCGQSSCAGPLAGKDFPLYEGVLPDLLQFCFACGDTSSYGITAARGQRMVGVCKRHLQLFELLRPSQEVSGEVLVHTGGTVIRIEKLLVRPALTLAQQILQTEFEWAEAGKKNDQG